MSTTVLVSTTSPALSRVVGLGGDTGVLAGQRPRPLPRRSPRQEGATLASSPGGRMNEQRVDAAWSPRDESASAPLGKAQQRLGWLWAPDPWKPSATPDRLGAVTIGRGRR